MMERYGTLVERYNPRKHYKNGLAFLVPQNGARSF